MAHEEIMPWAKFSVQQFFILQSLTAEIAHLSSFFM